MAYDEKAKKEELVEHLTKAVICLREINQQETKDDTTPAPHASLESTITNAVGNLHADIAKLKIDSMTGPTGKTGPS